MSNINRDFVEKLESFTDALGDIVILLKEQIKKDNTDVANKMLDNMPDIITQIAEDLKVVKEDVKSLKTTTDDIKKSVEDIKKGKETGVFGQITEDKNKQKIKEGVGIIILIAGGVLAMGMAFKLINKVDYKTVLSLSVATISLAWGFSEVYKIINEKRIDYLDIVKISSILPIMSIGLTVSANILSFIPTISLYQSLSILFVSGAMGVSLYLMSKSLNSAKMDNKTISQFLLLPIILPAMAGGIVLSSFLLNLIQPIGFNQLVSFVLISGGLGVSLFLMSKVLNSVKMDNKTISQFLLLPIILPAIAGGIVLSSWLLKLTAPFSYTEALNIAIVSLAIGLGTLAMLPVLISVGKFKLSPTDIAKSLGAIIGITGAIVVAAHIFQKSSDEWGVKYDDKTVPGYQWSLKVGLSLIVFGGAVLILSKIPKNTLIQGLIAVTLMAPIISLSSRVLSLGNYKDNYPSVKWASGVGLSMLVFGGATVALGAVIMLVIAGAGAVLGISLLMIGVAAILDQYDWKNTKYPSIEWSKSVGGSLLAFSLAMVTSVPGAVLSNIFEIFGAKPPLVKIAEQMKKVAETLNDFNWKSANYPTLGWSAGVGLALSTFAAMSLIAGGSRLIDNVISFFTGDKKSSIETLAEEMINTAKVMDDPIWDTNLKYPDPKWSEGVGNALFAFANTFKILDDVDIDNDDFEKESIILINGLKGVAKHMENQKWDNLQDTSGIKDWSDGVTMGISSFIDLIGDIDKMKYDRADRKSMEFIFEYMIYIKNQLDGENFNKINIKDWSDSVINGIKPFINLIGEINKMKYDRSDRVGLEKLVKTIVYISNELKDIKNLKPIPIEWGKSFSGFAVELSKIPSSLFIKSDILKSSIEKLSEIKVSDKIKKLSDSIKDLAKSLNELNTTSLDNLDRFSNSTLVMSLVDSEKLENFIEVLDDKKQDLSDILSIGNMQTSSETSPITPQIIVKNEEKTDDTEKFNKLMERLETIINYLGEMLDVKYTDTPSTFKYDRI